MFESAGGETPRSLSPALDGAAEHSLTSREVVTRLLESLRLVACDSAVLRDHVVAVGSTELRELMERLGAAALLIDAAEVVVAAEAFERGEPAAASPPTTPVGWIKTVSPRYALMGAARLTRLAQACTARATVEQGQQAFAHAVTTGSVTVGSAAAAVAHGAAHTAA